MMAQGISVVQRVNQSLRLFATPWSVPHQAPLSMGFSRQEYWSGLPFPSPGNLPDSGVKPESPALEGGFLTTEPPGKCPRFTLLIIENHKKFFKSHLLIFTDYKLKLRKLKHENTYIYTPLILKVKSSHSIWPLENSTLQL